MKVLGIDTSAKTCSVALLQDGTVLSSHFLGEGLTHSQTLLPMIKKTLEESGCYVSDLDLISITAGPGSFTGLRIGISTVKGLAFSHQIPCAAVSTLETCAENCKDHEGFTVCALMDARRGEFYNALFSINEADPHRLTPDRAVSGDTIAKELKKFGKIILVGDGAEKFASEFPEFQSALSPEKIRYQCGKGAAILGLKNYRSGLFTSAGQLAPVYLRLPQAEREWQAKNNTSSEVKI